MGITDYRGRPLDGSATGEIRKLCDQIEQSDGDQKKGLFNEISFLCYQGKKEIWDKDRAKAQASRPKITSLTLEYLEL